MSELKRTPNLDETTASTLGAYASGSYGSLQKNILDFKKAKEKVEDDDK